MKASFRCANPIGVYWTALCSYVYVRCRRCEGCMKVRQYGWTARAAHEQVFAKATWFITLTYGPRRRASVFARASAMEREKSAEHRLIKAAGGYVSNYFKLLRKSGYEFRYLCVPELHRNGFPHWHGLVHDQRGDLTWEALNSGWSPGFSVVKLVRDANALRYVTKYLCKEKLGRVRASLNYGAPDPSVDYAALRSGQRRPIAPQGHGAHTPV